MVRILAYVTDPSTDTHFLPVYSGLRRNNTADQLTSLAVMKEGLAMVRADITYAFRYGQTKDFTDSYEYMSLTKIKRS